MTSPSPDITDMTARRFEPLDVAVLRAPAGKLWVSATSRSAAVHGVLRDGKDVPTYTELKELTRNFHTAVEKASLGQGRTIGSRLTHLLFGADDLRGLFDQTRAVAADSGRSLLVRMLAAPLELQAVPWELTMDPAGGDGRFLALAPASHLVRVPLSRTYASPRERLRPPLNLLIVLSSPTLARGGEDDVFDLFEEKRILLDALGSQDTLGIVDSDGERLVNIDIEEHPTVENLRALVTSRRDGYHFIHYVGHATDTGLVLEDHLSRSLDVPSAEVSDLLRACPNLRMVVFAGCYTARSPGRLARAAERGLPLWRLSTADHCVRDSCPIVIGMQALLPFRTQWLFSRFFYRSIAAGFSVVEAVHLARSAIHGDDHVGSERVDWAVPSLFLSDSPPLVVLDRPPSATRVPRHPPTEPWPIQLKLDGTAGDRHFFSRMACLRLAVDVLSANTRNHVLLMLGPSGAGKSRLIDRALQDIRDKVDFILYARAKHLNPDPLLKLCNLVAELLTKADGKRREPSPGWSGLDWWDRLFQDLAEQRFVIALDDIETLVSADDLGQAFAKLRGRQSLCRLALIGTEVPNGLRLRESGMPPARIFVRPLSFHDIDRWVRRNEPVLSAKCGDRQRLRFFSMLGTDLELWSRLAARVAKSSGEDIAVMVNEVLEPKQIAAAKDLRQTNRLPRSQRPLRIAVTGPSALEKTTSFALTEWAVKHRVSGRVPISDPDNAGALASVISVPEPDLRNGPTEERITRWLEAVADQDADIVLVGYGTPDTSERQRDVVGAICKSALVVSPAADDRGTPLYPALYDEVLAVGSTSTSKALAEDSARTYAGKPQLLAPDSLADEAALTYWVNDRDPRGGAAAALRVVASAVLVWATRPGKDAMWVKQTLRDSGKKVGSTGTSRWSPPELDIQSALDRARDEEVLEALVEASGDLTLLELMATVGFPLDQVTEALARLTTDIDRRRKTSRVVKVQTTFNEVYQAVR